MELKEIRKLIKEFKFSRDESIFELLTKDLKLQKCIVTGKDIIYPNTIIRISKERTLKIEGTSSNSKKIINGKKYHLQVSYNGMLIKFGDEYSKLNTSKIFNTLNKFTKFAFQIEDKDYELEKSTSFGAGVSLDIMIKRYGKEEGSARFNRYKQKQAYTNSFEYKNKKYNWSKEDYDRFNKSRGITLNNLISKYGKKEGELRFEKYCQRQSITSTYEYLLNKFGKDRADQILDARGKRITFFESIYKDNAVEKYIEYWNNIKNPFYSKKSIELFEMLILDLNLRVYDIYYKEQEYGIYNKQTQNYFKYDFTIPELNLIIEFNGDSWHGNPSMYMEHDKPHPIDKEVTAGELWDYDKIKKNTAESKGFKVLYVWENDYVNNFNKTYTILKEQINEIRNRRN